MSVKKISALATLAAMVLGLSHAPSAAQSNPAPLGNGETIGQTNTPSAADVGITAMMQMLRDEGIDIDARMRRARSDCRQQVTSEAQDANAEEIEKAVEACAVVDEGVIYARAINEMNANRVNNFNNSMAQYNAQVAEAERKKRDYELEVQGHNAEVAEIERQQQVYEQDLAAHQQLLADRAGGSKSIGSVRSLLGALEGALGLGASEKKSSSENSPARSAMARADTPQPVQTAAVDEPALTAPEPVRGDPSPSARPTVSNSGALAANMPANASTQPTRSQPSQNTPTHNTPALTRGSGAAPAPGKMLSQGTGTSSQDDLGLAIMESTGPRIALVIGNEEYTGGMGSLANPVNDAVLIGATLRSLGFDVEILTDASQRDMKQAVQRLGDRLRDAGDNATGLFYYAGHGVQSKGNNFLIPVGSVIDAESDLELEAVKADAILAQMEEAYVSTRIVILDACRNMPLRRRSRNGARGLARMETPNGSFVAYSTSPGSTAADGGGIHSPFAEALAKQMLVPDRPIEVTFREVRRQVVEMTSGDQVPWDSSSLLETFSFYGTM